MCTERQTVMPVGLAVCSLFTLRYDAPYILPWLAHHRLLGVDRVILYHDDASGMWNSTFSTTHSKLLSVLQDARHSDWLTFHSTAALNLSTQFQQLTHCNLEALKLNASWVGNWDADEVLHTITPRGASIAAVVAVLDPSAQAIILPRFEMLASPFPQFPPRATLSEYETYTRHLGPNEGGKTLWRPNTLVEHSSEGGHGFKLEDERYTNCPIRFHYLDECGSRITVIVKVLHNHGAFCSMNLKELAGARIYHFRYRSVSECLRKAELTKLYIGANGFGRTPPPIYLSNGQKVQVPPGNLSGRYTRRTCLKASRWDFSLGRWVNLKCAAHKKSLVPNTATTRAFIDHTFMDGLATLGEEQQRFIQRLVTFMNGGSPDF